MALILTLRNGIAFIPDNKLSVVLGEYELISEAYMGRITEMIARLKEKDNEIALLKKDLEVKDKDAVLLQKDVALLEKDLEVAKDKCRRLEKKLAKKSSKN